MNITYMDRDEYLRQSKEQALAAVESPLAPTMATELQVQREIEALRSQHEAAVSQVADLEDEILSQECQLLRIQLSRSEYELAALMQDAS